MKTTAVVAVARELVGFIWVIAHEVNCSGWQGVPMEAGCSGVMG